MYKAIGIGSLFFFLFLYSYPLPNREEPNPKQEKVTKTPEKKHPPQQKSPKQKNKSPLTEKQELAILFTLIVIAIAIPLYFQFKKTPEKKQPKDKNQPILDALLAFNYMTNNIKNKDIFNEKELNKRFRKRSKEVHPDIIGGTKEKFQRLQKKRQILLNLVKQRDHNQIDINFI